MKLLAMTVSEFSDFIAYNHFAYVWFGAMILGLFVIAFFIKSRSKTR